MEKKLARITEIHTEDAYFNNSKGVKVGEIIYAQEMKEKANEWWGGDFKYHKNNERGYALAFRLSFINTEESTLEITPEHEFTAIEAAKRIHTLERLLKDKTIENECLEKSLHAMTEKIDAVYKLVCVGYASEDRHRIEQDNAK